MPQVFAPRLTLFVKLALWGGLSAAVLTCVGVWAYTRPEAVLGESFVQPIPFSHKHHVGDVGLDCRFCHVSVESHASPGMPSAQTCLTCHSRLFADQSVFEPLQRSASTGQPIAWQQVNRLPDYVYFDHSVHVAKGVACIECHGRIDQMALVSRVHALQMKWCVACHQNPAPRLHPPAEVFAMPPGRLSNEEARSVAKALQIESSTRLTDCSTCHR